jgi:hypothetical protein
MDTRSAARRWAETWKRNWIAGEADPISDLYGPAAHFRSGPFRTPHVGRAGALEYVAQNFATESEVTVEFAEPLVDGRRAAVPWWASYTENGQRLTIAGTSLIRFDAEGLVEDQWDTWNSVEGERAPYEGLAR